MTRRRARYSRILRGQGAPGSRERYLQYLAGIDNVSRVGSGRKRSGTVRLQIDPFGIDLPANVLIAASCTGDARTEIAVASVTSRSNLVGSSVDRVLRLSNFIPARVILTTGVSPDGTPETSRTTGQSYLKYGGTSNSHPFGQNASNTDTYAAAVLDIETELLGQNATGRRVSFQAEIIGN